jgi:large conductance mechanosensitive channel
MDDRRHLDLRLTETRIPTFFGEFKSFLTRSNALALAVGFIVGSATGKVVTAIVDDVFMPLLGLVLPSGGWRNARIVLDRRVGPDGKPVENAILYGDLIGKAVDFVLIAFVIFVVTKWVLRALPVATRACPECMELVPVTAKRCKACTSPLPPLPSLPIV